MYALGGDGRRGIGSSRIKEEIAVLYPPAEREKVFQQLQRGKRNALLIIMLAGIVLTGILFFYRYHETMLDREGNIRRNTYGEGSRRAELIALTQYGGEDIKETVTVDIPEKQYTPAEAETLFEKMLPELDKLVLADNESLESVQSNLNFVKELPGYPFTFLWESSHYDVIDTSGVVNTEKAAKAGTLVQIKADISYGEFRKEYIFYARVIPKQKTEAEKQREKLDDALEAAKEDTQYEDYFVLPKTIDTKQVVWKEKRDYDSFLFLVFLLAAAVCVCAGKNQELHKRVEKRNQELRTDYPEIVCKLALLTGAGMTLRNAFSKITADYKRKKKNGHYRYAYEEILYTCNEMDTGVPEVQAYVNWGQRCRMKLYLKLSMLLVQNLKKGSAGLIRSLREETELAFAEKKAEAKRAGEEAGTKLLLPMGLMLLIVMVLIIVPAFASFG